MVGASGGNLRWTSTPSRGNRNTPSRLILQKPEIAPALMSLLARPITIGADSVIALHFSQHVNNTNRILIHVYRSSSTSCVLFLIASMLAAIASSARLFFKTYSSS